MSGDELDTRIRFAANDQSWSARLAGGGAKKKITFQSTLRQSGRQGRTKGENDRAEGRKTMVVIRN